MATVKCAYGKRGYPSHEWNDGKKDRIYCCGWIDKKTDEYLPECLSCKDHVNKAQDDLEKFYGRAGESKLLLCQVNEDDFCSYGERKNNAADRC